MHHPTNVKTVMRIDPYRLQSEHISIELNCTCALYRHNCNFRTANSPVTAHLKRLSVLKTPLVRSFASTGVKTEQFRSSGAFSDTEDLFGCTLEPTRYHLQELRKDLLGGREVSCPVMFQQPSIHCLLLHIMHVEFIDLHSHYHHGARGLAVECMTLDFRINHRPECIIMNLLGKAT